MFIATGQDAANVAELHAAIVYAQLLENGDYYWSITLPALIVATVGGGTGLATQTNASRCSAAGVRARRTSSPRSARRPRWPATFRCPARSSPATGCRATSATGGTGRRRLTGLEKRMVGVAGSNPRPLVPQTSALTGLRYTPTDALIGKAAGSGNPSANQPLPACPDAPLEIEGSRELSPRGGRRGRPASRGWRAGHGRPHPQFPDGAVGDGQVRPAVSPIDAMPSGASGRSGNAVHQCRPALGRGAGNVTRHADPDIAVPAKVDDGQRRRAPRRASNGAPGARPVERIVSGRAVSLVPKDRLQEADLHVSPQYRRRSGSRACAARAAEPARRLAEAERLGVTDEMDAPEARPDRERRQVERGAGEFGAGRRLAWQSGLRSRNAFRCFDRLGPSTSGQRFPPGQPPSSARRWTRKR